MGIKCSDLLETFHMFCNVINIFHLTVPWQMSVLIAACRIRCVLFWPKLIFLLQPNIVNLVLFFFFTPSYLYTQFISPHKMQGFGIPMLLINNTTTCKFYIQVMCVWYCMNSLVFIWKGLTQTWCIICSVGIVFVLYIVVVLEI